MIIKGGSRSGPEQLAKHLQRRDTNETVEILELQSPAPNLNEALRDWQTLSEGTLGTKGLYHVNIDPAKEYVMTPEQWQRCVEVLEKELGFEGQPRAVVMHEKHGRQHIHVVWARTDIDTMTLRSDSMNYPAHERASKALELEFGHEPVPGKHAKRDREKQPEFPNAAVNHAEWQQAERTGIKPADRKDQITALQQASDSGQAFKTALEAQGYMLAKGDRGFVLVDQAGEVYSLVRQIHGMKAAELREFMKGVDPQTLPTVDQAREARKQQVLIQPEAPASSEPPTPKPPEPVSDPVQVQREVETEALRKAAAARQEEEARRPVEPQPTIEEKKAPSPEDMQALQKTFAEHLREADILQRQQAELERTRRMEDERRRFQPMDRITVLQQRSATAEAFRLALVAEGCILARGDRGDLMIVDRSGAVYGLAGQIPGMTTHEFQEFMQGIDPRTLPSVRQAAQIHRQDWKEKRQQARAEAAAVERSAPRRPKKKAFRPSPEKQEALKPELIPASVKAQKEAQRQAETEALRKAVIARHLEARGYMLAKGSGGFVLVDQAGEVYSVYRLARQTRGMKTAELREFMKDIDPQTLPTVEQAALLQQQKLEEKKQAAEKPPEPSQPAEQTKIPSPEENQAIQKAVSEREARELADLRQRHDAEFRHTRDILDADIAESMGHFDARQEAERSRFERGKAPAAGLDFVIDSIQRWWNPKQVQKREAERERRQNEMRERQQTERDKYKGMLEQTRDLELENLTERHAQQLRDHAQRTKDDLDRYLREQEAARKLRAELEERERERDKERTRDGPEWPPPRAR